MANAELRNYIASELMPGEFEPFASFNEVGDCIRFLIKPDKYYRDRINDLVTAYVSFETKEIIGGQIKGIKNLLEQAPLLHHVVHKNGRVRGGEADCTQTDQGT